MIESLSPELPRESISGSESGRGMASSSIEDRGSWDRKIEDRAAARDPAQRRQEKSRGTPKGPPAGRERRSLTERDFCRPLPSVKTAARSVSLTYTLPLVFLSQARRGDTGPLAVLGDGSAGDIETALLEPLGEE